MKCCWKCGGALPEEATACPCCGAQESDRCPLPAGCGEEMQALRAIYDHYGPKQTLMGSTTLCNAIGDYLGEDGKKLRSQVRIAMDSGLGQAYLEQLQAPKANFETRCVTLLTDAGLAKATATQLVALFHGMVGFPVPGQAAAMPTNEPERSQFPPQQPDGPERSQFPPRQPDGPERSQFPPRQPDGLERSQFPPPQPDEPEPEDDLTSWEKFVRVGMISVIPMVLIIVVLAVFLQQSRVTDSHRNAPTEAPTAAVTEAPTAVLTEVPTAVPTEAPTAVPTEVPTPVPTEAPTAVPTQVPTPVPTAVPTAVPTEVPTTVPTAVPTAVPTQVPTPVPTAVAGKTNIDFSNRQTPNIGNFPVYSGPGTQYYRANSGRATLATNDWFLINGQENGWLMVYYELTAGGARVGYVSIADMGGWNGNAEKLIFQYSPAVMARKSAVWDDPNQKTAAVYTLYEGKQVTYLCDYWRGDHHFAYIEVNADGTLMRGFVEYNDVTIQ